jgi:sulfite reductase (NADPH) hemoprotein beta-component
VVRVYNRWGRRDNIYKARIKILVKAEGQRYIDEVEAEYRQILSHDGAPHTISQQELDRVSASFVVPASRVGELPLSTMPIPTIDASDDNYTRWLARNVAPHKNPALRCVTLSFKRLGYSPGDATGPQLDIAADLADRYSAGEARVTHDQNLVLPWVRADELPALYAEAKAAGLAKANVRLLTDMIVCPGGDFCALANARSLPISEAISQRYQDLDELHDLGEIDVHMSGCINSCGHHHSAHIGILGVDKDGQEWYQVTLGGSDGSDLSGGAVAGKVVGPSFAAAEVPEVIEAVLDTYRSVRQSGGAEHGGQAETFIDTLRRVGHDPFKQAANAARTSTGRAAPQATATPA